MSREGRQDDLRFDVLRGVEMRTPDDVSAMLALSRRIYPRSRAKKGYLAPSAPEQPWSSPPPCRPGRAAGRITGCEMDRLGHEVKLIAPRYVKPFIKRQKNDGAEAVVEAALRPTMRFVEPKSGEQQARAIVFRTREQFLNQRTEAFNALRSHLYESGYVAPQGTTAVQRRRAARRHGGNRAA